jgi:hypothetical protein
MRLHRGLLQIWLHPTAARRLRLVQPHLVTFTHSDHLLLLGFPRHPRQTNFTNRQALARRTTFVRTTDFILTDESNRSSEVTSHKFR